MKDLTYDPKWPLQRKHARDREHLTAVVKGGGPGGAAAAIALAQQGYQVKLVERRPTHVRRNPVVLRPEAVRQLAKLGATEHLQDALVPIEQFDVYNEFADSHTVSIGPPKPADNRWSQRGSHTVRLCDLEDALLRAAQEQGVEVVHNATISLEQTPETRRNHVLMMTQNETVDLGYPDLVVMAAGKNDSALHQELGLTRTRNANLCAPSKAPTESQRFVLVTLKARQPAPLDNTFSLHIRSDRGAPLCEASLDHLGERSVLMQLPRGLDEDPQVLTPYALKRINALLGIDYPDADLLLADYQPLCGSLSEAFTVEQTRASSFFHGTNTVLTGDSGGTSSPACGIGAEIATTLDALNIGALGAALRVSKRRDGLRRYQQDKTASLRLWGGACQTFFISKPAQRRMLQDVL